MSCALKPCPHCGGEAVRQDIGKTPWGISVVVRCRGCEAMVSSANGCATQEQAERSAFDRWNRRAERTCRDVGVMDDFKCSECGCTLCMYGREDGEDTWALFDGDGKDTDPRFCPCCGARVVDDDE